MKKLVSIQLTIFLLLTGLQITCSVHYCRGMVSAASWSVTEARTCCDMDSQTASSPIDTGITQECCSDMVLAYEVAPDYFGSSFSINFTVVGVPIIGAITAPLAYNLESQINWQILANYLEATSKNTSLPILCVFRI